MAVPWLTRAAGPSDASEFSSTRLARVTKMLRLAKWRFSTTSSRFSDGSGTAARGFSTAPTFAGIFPQQGIRSTLLSKTPLLLQTLRKGSGPKSSTTGRPGEKLETST